MLLENEKKNISKEKLIFQAAYEERLESYRMEIRQSFARKKSIFFVLPTIHEATRFHEILKKGVEDNAYLVHGEFSKKKLLESYEAIMKNLHPVIIVGTAPFLSIPRGDLGTIIVERESSSSYKTISRPFIDLRLFAELFASEIESRLILADTLVRAETIERYNEHELSELALPSFRLHGARPIIVPTNIKTDGEKKEFRIISDESKRLVEDVVKNGQNIFLFTLRKGLAPSTVCNDCSTTVLCDTCTAPLILFKKDNGSTYRCPMCKKIYNPKTRCKNCGSWNLTTLGIGTENTAEAVKKLFPDISIFIIDAEKVKTRAQGKKIAEQFYKTKGAILVGTELALSHLNEKVGAVAIISFDSLFSLPSFRIGEKIVQLVAILQALSDMPLLIQTKNPEEQILGYLHSGNLTDFYRGELHDRKMLNYPPFSTLIKVTVKTKPFDTIAVKDNLAKIFANYAPDIIPAGIPKIKGFDTTLMILKIKPETWQKPILAGTGTFDTTLSDLLTSLPPSFQIEVNPENLF
jgi:primosomal protein N' (replication factor Y)